MYCKLISVIQKATEDNATCNSAIYCFNCQSRRNCRRIKMIPCGSWSPKMAPNKPPFPVFTPLCSLNEHALALLLALTDRMKQKRCYANSKSQTASALALLGTLSHHVRSLASLLERPHGGVSWRRNSKTAWGKRERPSCQLSPGF